MGKWSIQILGQVSDMAAGRRKGEICTGIPKADQLAGKKKLHR